MAFPDGVVLAPSWNPLLEENIDSLNNLFLYHTHQFLGHALLNALACITPFNILPEILWALSRMNFGLNINHMGDLDKFYETISDDEELEQELMRLQAEIRPKQGKKVPVTAVKAKPSHISSLADIEMFAANIDSDVLDDAEIDDDPDLLNELNDLLDSDNDDYDEVVNTISKSIAGPLPNAIDQLLKSRLTMYEKAVQASKNDGDALKARRFERGVKTIEGLLNDVKRDVEINEEDIPPIIPSSALKSKNDTDAVEPTSSDIRPSVPSGSPGDLVQQRRDRLPHIPTRPAPPAPPIVPRCSVLPPIVPRRPSQFSTDLPFSSDNTSSPGASAKPEEDNKNTVQLLLTSRRDEYKRAALNAKRGGDTPTAVKCFRTAKQLDELIDAHSRGAVIDISTLPCASSELPASSGVLLPAPIKEASSLSTVSEPKPQVVQLQVKSAEPVPVSVDNSTHDDADEFPNPDNAKHLFNVPGEPASVLEALEQRLAKYKLSAEKAKEENDTAKARRMTRIQKQYEQAIKDHKFGRAVDFNELPTPPGFPPIPFATPKTSAASQGLTVPPSAKAQAGASTYKSTPNLNEAGPGTHNLLSVKPEETSRRRSSSSERLPIKQPCSSSQSPVKPASSKQQQQLNFLLERQQLFKEAAVAAKRQNKTELAMSFLKQAKGFNKMIEASQNGLPVNISEVPVPPQLRTTAISPASTSVNAENAVGVLVEEDWVFLLGSCSKIGSSSIGKTSKSDSSVASSVIVGSSQEIYAMLEKDLIRQFQLCCQNAEYFTKMGDVTKTCMFDSIGADSKRDLAALRVSLQRGEQPPVFHYENKQFPVLHCCPDLSDSDLEIGVIRANQINPPAGYEPKDLDVFVRLVFPFPQEDPPLFKTDCVKGTNCPTWNWYHKLNINRKSRQLLRVIKSKSVKFEVYQKGGFLRSDKNLGQCDAKLSCFEEACELHDCYDLTDGRKPVGGKLEVKIRMREPLVKKQFEQLQVKWLVIDEIKRS